MRGFSICCGLQFDLDIADQLLHLRLRITLRKTSNEILY